MDVRTEKAKLTYAMMKAYADALKTKKDQLVVKFTDRELWLRWSE